MKPTYLLLAAAACNLTMTVWMAFCLAHDFSEESRKKKEVSGVQVFRYFTIDSNVLSSLTALAMAALEIRVLTGSLAAIPTWMTVLKYVATTAVTLTMLTVLFFLGPTQGYRRMLSGDNLYMHLIGPLLAILTFCFLERGAALRMTDTLIAVIPALIYGTVYLLQVVVRKKWPDSYGFNIGGKWPLSFAAILGASWGIALLLRLLCNSML